MAPAVLVNIAVEHPQKALDAVAAADGSVAMPVTDIPGAVTIAILADPDGN